MLTPSQECIKGYSAMILRGLGIRNRTNRQSYPEKPTCSINLPIPLCVTLRPPKSCTASVEDSCAHLVLYIFKNAIGPASLLACSLYDCNNNSIVRLTYYGKLMKVERASRRKGTLPCYTSGKSHSRANFVHSPFGRSFQPTYSSPQAGSSEVFRMLCAAMST